MFKVITNHPVAVDADDHLHPEGVFYDNNLNPAFVNDVEKFYGENKINFLDQGCSGGALAIEFHKRGHNSLGLEGSDQILKPSSELMTEKKGRKPAGYDNWQEFHGKNLFTCDITKEYQILLDDKPFEADLITSWDVMEHFHENQVEEVIKQTVKHMKVGGLFIANISLIQSGRLHNPECTYEIHYHKTVQPAEWWLDKLNKYLTQVPCPFANHNRAVFSHHLLYAGVKN